MYRLPRWILLAGVVFATSAVPASAQLATFASFQVAGRGTGINYEWTNNGPASASMNCTFQANFVAFGNYLSNAIANTGGAFPVSGIVPATVSVNVTTTSPASVFGTNIQQNLNSAGTMVITANSPIAGSSNLLTMNFTGTLTGPTHGNQVMMAGLNTSNLVNFASSFVSFSGTTSRSYLMQATSVLPALDIVNTFMDSWNTDFSTTSFQSDLADVPEPSSVAMLGLLGVGCAYTYRRRRQKAKALAKAQAAKEELAKAVVQPTPA